MQVLHTSSYDRLVTYSLSVAFTIVMWLYPNNWKENTSNVTVTDTAAPGLRLRYQNRKDHRIYHLIKWSSTKFILDSVMFCWRWGQKSKAYISAWKLPHKEVNEEIYIFINQGMLFLKVRWNYCIQLNAVITMKKWILKTTICNRC